MVATASKGYDLGADKLEATKASMFFIHGDADGVRCSLSRWLSRSAASNSPTICFKTMGSSGRGGGVGSGRLEASVLMLLLRRTTPLSYFGVFQRSDIRLSLLCRGLLAPAPHILARLDLGGSTQLSP